MKVVTLGEMMIRFMPAGNRRFEQAESFEAYYGGDECIVACSLARFGAHSVYLTKLPRNPLGDICLQKLRAQGVDTSQIVRGGERLGLNFYENGAAVRPSSVLYDRSHSAISEALPSEFDLDAAMEGADWFHFAGITPAISDQAAELTRAAAQCARRHGVTVSCDLNYRSKLWSVEKAKEVMAGILPYVDVCIGGLEDADRMIGLESLKVQQGSFNHSRAEYEAAFRELTERFGFRMMLSTLREGANSSENTWAALLYDGHDFYETTRYTIHLVDRGGGGASCSAAFIYGVLSGFDLAKTGEFAVAASALKQTITGDLNLVNLDEVYSLMEGKGSGRVSR